MKSYDLPRVFSEIDPQIKATKKEEKSENIYSSVLSEYCSKAGIHGIGYVGAKDITIIERIWWLIVFALSVLTCAYLIFQTYTKWQNSPVMVSFSQEQTPIWEIPFPAVTICPINKIRKSVYNYTEAYKNRYNLTGPEYKKFWDVSLACYVPFFMDASNANKTTDKYATDYIKEVAPQLNETIMVFFWQNKVFTSELFAPLLTEEGICFTINSFNQNDMYTNEQDNSIKLIDHDRRNKGWSVENGYPDDANMTTYPMRIAQDGMLAGLRIPVLSKAYDREYACGIPTSGYKVLLHNPAETPRVSQQYILAPLNRHTTVTVMPQMITTSKGLLDIPSDTRNCYFSHERSLRFYAVYTQENCQMECDSNFTKAICGCVPFHMARDKETPICGYGSIDCLESAKLKSIEYKMMEKKNKVNEAAQNSPESQIYLNCNCLPSCAHLKYSAETSHAPFHFLEFVKATNKYDDGDEKYDIARIDIFFKETQFLAMHRSELYGNTDFLANCGGLLGLFMGFSCLSLLEMIYFATLRLWCRMKKQNKVN